VGEVLVLSLTAAVNPTLVTVTTMMLLLPAPRRLMTGYLLGAMLVSISLGLLIVFELKDSALASSTRHTLSPVADLALGGLALLAAFVLAGGHVDAARERVRRRRDAKDRKPPRWQRILDRGSGRLAFLVGICLTLPGASYLAGLSAISRLDYPVATTVAVVVAFNLVMLVLIELPLLGYLVAPEATPRTVDRFKAWFARRARHYAVIGLTVIGAALVLKGLVGLV
jgi:hypothetical protein